MQSGNKDMSMTSPHTLQVIRPNDGTIGSQNTWAGTRQELNWPCCAPPKTKGCGLVKFCGIPKLGAPAGCWKTGPACGETEFSRQSQAKGPLCCHPASILGGRSSCSSFFLICRMSGAHAKSSRQSRPKAPGNPGKPLKWSKIGPQRVLQNSEDPTCSQ